VNSLSPRPSLSSFVGRVVPGRLLRFTDTRHAGCRRRRWTFPLRFNNWQTTARRTPVLHAKYLRAVLSYFAMMHYTSLVMTVRFPCDVNTAHQCCNRAYYPRLAIPRVSSAGCSRRRAHRCGRGKPTTPCPGIWFIVYPSMSIGLLKTPVHQIPGVATSTMPRGNSEGSKGGARGCACFLSKITGGGSI
jgi:hypothetical protein